MNGKKKIILIDVLVLVVAAIALGVSMIFARDIELSLGLLYYAEAEDTRDSADVMRNADGIYISADGETAAELNVHFVDVGQGDCAIIELPDGKTMLIDGGENTKSVENSIQTFIDKTLAPDFEYFDYAILTHADSDHCGSLDYVLGKYPARFVYRPNVEAVGTSANPYTDPGKADLTSNARTKNTAVYANAVKAMYHESDDMTSVVYVTDANDDSQTITGGEGDDAYTFTFYTPLSARYTGDGDWNNYSPVMILEYHGYRIAMSGDAEEKNLKEFTAKVAAAKTDGVTDKYDAFTDDYCVNVIKAGHHGSENATTLDYLNVLTTPSGAQNVYCVISCGKGNSYGHPHAAALERYRTVGLPDENILRTDEAGDITFTVRVDDEGNYKLFYGEKQTQSPVKPDGTNGNESVLVYKKLGNIELKWQVVGSALYAVLAVIVISHIVLVSVGTVGGPSGGKKRKH